MGRPAPGGIKIIDATPDDAPLIARAIMDAIGPELVQNMAGPRGTADDVYGVFLRLAQRPDTQYSYRNTRIALAPDGTKAGVCVSYDGGRLKELRRPFFDEARRVFGWQITPEEVDALPGETDPDEFYLDSLATLPSHRGQGIATALILDARTKAAAAGLPLGLLCADHNPAARRLYESLGFRPHSRKPFAGELMTNLRLNYPPPAPNYKAPYNSYKTYKSYKTYAAPNQPTHTPKKIIFIFLRFMAHPRS